MNRVRFCNVRLMSILGSCQGPRLQRSTIYVHDVDLSAIGVFHNFNNSLTKESTRRGLSSNQSIITSTQVVPSVHTKVYQNSYSNETISRYLVGGEKKKKKDNRHTYPYEYINSTYTLSIKSNCNKGKLKKKKSITKEKELNKPHKQKQETGKNSNCIKHITNLIFLINGQQFLCPSPFRPRTWGGSQGASP